nr:hypothetical protein [Oscillibacter sp. 1-3]
MAGGRHRLHAPDLLHDPAPRLRPVLYAKGILPPEVKIRKVCKGVISFIIIIVLVPVLCAVFPPLSTWLPSTLAA